ncbi:MAG: hypothetical protein UX16_C0012G0007 [Parcubacteria group bacterium GW2011_GWB1_45_7]|uniref:Uncharacterized protein n=2 Tax=Candidatus Colwelliibacteriota TaxID=1817904 RepID=A0A1G1ZB37_9BACT|nr:MAG: hypothetical protein UX16_C0012G0007 [Parcubacteria group bacterium GW2011_GWB1_45_7]OGY58565.1 MAG: hypothetical protein A3C03_01095 [Candidatus Colwellbacteria bacterium RIFCSPHIGHO2_02_FULL_45_17]OGY61644.1 MAG: hypothetical protein A3I33_00960 [Candidatus Colwellbacteria bacterium RIFCSPLOWO2_02_FULL_45_11]OGY61868.1 MAG: hypothetical protein A3G58_01215 [Candidatus Colwellbacteria bacterium RIFCSPLOWO2_12_FULL_46_17]
MAQKVKFPALKDMERFVVVASDEEDCIAKYTAEKPDLEKLGWECKVYAPGEYPCVIRGYEDRNGWQVVCEAHIRSGKVVTDMYAFNVHERQMVSRYPNDFLARSILAQTIGTATDRLIPKSRDRRNK